MLLVMPYFIKWLYFAVVCPDNLSAPSDGTIDITGTFVGSQAFYSCAAGFTLVGPDKRTCLSNGFWSGNDPVCIPPGTYIS